MPRLLVVFAVVWLTGCAQSHILNPDDPDARTELNARARGKASLVTLRSGEHFSAHHLHVEPEVTTWIDPATDEFHTASTTEVASIEFVDHAYGAQEGIGFGLGAGISLGALVGLMLYDENECFIICEPRFYAEYYAVAFGAAGLVLGSLIGFGRGSRMRYTVPAPAERP